MARLQAPPLALLIYPYIYALLDMLRLVYLSGTDRLPGSLPGSKSYHPYVTGLPRSPTVGSVCVAVAPACDTSHNTSLPVHPRTQKASTARIPSMHCLYHQMREGVI